MSDDLHVSDQRRVGIYGTVSVKPFLSLFSCSLVSSRVLPIGEKEYLGKILLL